MNTNAYRSIQEQFSYLIKQQSKGYPGSSSIHPRVERGRTVHKKVNTCKPSKDK